tara:strand:- start:2327 stop:4021 length:1695 start_codon:yes stop_codon:yes gene_type:complete
MDILELEQGSDEWIAARLEHSTASEAPIMMGESKFMTRNQLLALKHGWESNPNSSFKEKLFQKGHDVEDQAREHLEFDHLEDFPPIVGSVVVDGLLFLASFDGLCMDVSPWLPWEHKLWNDTLAENVRNETLPGQYYWQLEHQMLVADVTEMKFTVSDGTEIKLVDMIYESVPERRQALIDGWNQFEDDLEDYEPEARQEAVVAAQFEGFQIIEFKIEGSEVLSNIPAVLSSVKERAKLEMSKVLESDQDFADKKEFNKATKQARADLKAMAEKVQANFTTQAEFANLAKELDGVLQKMQSHGEKQVKDAEAAKKDSIKSNAFISLNEFISEVNRAIEPIRIMNVLPNFNPDWDGAMKNKRTLESLQAAVDQELADCKIELTKHRDIIKTNLDSLREHGDDHKFLFKDINDLITKDNEALCAIIKMRISEYDIAEKEKTEKLAIALAEKMRVDAENKAMEVERNAADAQAKKVASAKEADRLEAIAMVDKKAAEFVAANQKVKTNNQAEIEPINRPKVAIEGQARIETKLKFWAFDYGLEDTVVTDLVQIMSEFGIEVDIEDII